MSFGSWDREWVRLLHADLKRCGFKIFFDQKDLVPGKLHEPQLEQGMTQGHLIFVVSPDSVESYWVSQDQASAITATLLEHNPKADKRSCRGRVAWP